MDKNMDKIMDKIRKVLAMSTSANEHEAAAFAAKVQSMLAEHNLSLSDIEDKGDNGDESIVIDNEEKTTPYPWRRPVAQGVAKMYFCEYYYQTVKHKGPPHDLH